MITFLVATVLATQAKTPLRMKGTFVEACTCMHTCQFEVAGATPTCQALGAYSITSGTYDGKDISGVKLAFVVAPDNLVYLYSECPPSKADVAKRLAFALFGSFGKTQGLQTATIRVSKTDSKPGHYSLSINGGQTASLNIEPILGGDGKTPVVLNNVYGDPYDALWQARVIDGAFKKAGHEFSIKYTNAYYIADLKVDKRI